MDKGFYDDSGGTSEISKSDDKNSVQSSFQDTTNLTAFVKPKVDNRILQDHKLKSSISNQNSALCDFKDVRSQICQIKSNQTNNFNSLLCMNSSDNSIKSKYLQPKPPSNNSNSDPIGSFLTENPKSIRTSSSNFSSIYPEKSKIPSSLESSSFSKIPNVSGDKTKNQGRPRNTSSINSQSPARLSTFKKASSTEAYDKSFRSSSQNSRKNHDISYSEVPHSHQSRMFSPSNQQPSSVEPPVNSLRTAVPPKNPEMTDSRTAHSYSSNRTSAPNLTHRFGTSSLMTPDSTGSNHSQSYSSRSNCKSSHNSSDTFQAEEPRDNSNQRFFHQPPHYFSSSGAMLHHKFFQQLPPGVSSSSGYYHSQSNSRPISSSRMMYMESQPGSYMNFSAPSMHHPRPFTPASKFVMPPPPPPPPPPQCQKYHPYMYQQPGLSHFGNNFPRLPQTSSYNYTPSPRTDNVKQIFTSSANNRTCEQPQRFSDSSFPGEVRSDQTFGRPQSQSTDWKETSQKSTTSPIFNLPPILQRKKSDSVPTSTSAADLVLGSSPAPFKKTPRKVSRVLNDEYENSSTFKPPAKTDSSSDMTDRYPKPPGRQSPQLERNSSKSVLQDKRNVQDKRFKKKVLSQHRQHSYPLSLEQDKIQNVMSSISGESLSSCSAVNSPVGGKFSNKNAYDRITKYSSSDRTNSSSQKLTGYNSGSDNFEDEDGIYQANVVYIENIDPKKNLNVIVSSENTIEAPKNYKLFKLPRGHYVSPHHLKNPEPSSYLLSSILMKSDFSGQKLLKIMKNIDHLISIFSDDVNTVKSFRSKFVENISQENSHDFDQSVSHISSIYEEMIEELKIHRVDLLKLINFVPLYRSIYQNRVES